MYPRSGKPLTADAAVIATGARLSRLAGRWLRVPVQAGHGYSFTVPVDRPIPGPDLPAGRAGGVHALQGRNPCFGHHGIPPPA